MFAQSSTSSPFGAPRPSSNPYGTPQSISAFAQQQQPSSFFGSSTGAGQPQHGFSGPQFGGGNHGYGQGSPAGGFGGSQFGAGGGGGGGYGSPYGAGQQGAAGGAGVGGTPGQAKRNYLPGYLSGGAAAQQEASSPQPMGEERSWDSPAGRRTSVSGSPVTRFGGGSLFGGTTGTPSKSPKFTPYTAPPRATAYRAEPEEDAPPVASLHEFDSQEPSGLHAESAFNPLRRSPSGDPSSASPFSSSIGLPHASSSSSSEGYPVNIFGFPPSALDLVLDYFSQFGEVVSKTPSPEGGNWITLSYAQPWSAARAARKNGEILGGVIMVGVKAVDEDSLKRALAGAEGDSGVHSASGTGTPVPRPPPAAVSTPSGVGKPVNVLGPQSAFKAQPTPTRKGFLGIGGGGASGTPTSGGGDAQASLFAERSKAAVLAQQQEGQPKSALGRVSEAIFGW
ncbi:hypothetical protein JCM11251_000330 [Rhodosporidiobolus azoricus]